LTTLLGTAGLALALTACAGGGAAASVTPPPNADSTITAKGSAFQSNDVTVPAGRPFQLFFKNLDGQAHNVAIYQDSSASQPLFVGENVTDGAVTYEIPALPEGRLFFRCDVHPNMQGTIRTSPTT
jgi:plastocyanin